MSDFSTMLGIGIIASIIGSVILLVSQGLLKCVVLPWIRDQVYCGTRVNGTWTLSDGDKFSQKETYSIRQNASNISGTLTLVPKNQNNGIGTRVLQTTGIVRDGFVMLESFPINNDNLGFQTVLLKISGHGSEMEGCATYYNIEKSKIQSISVKYSRSK